MLKSVARVYTTSCCHSARSALLTTTGPTGEVITNLVCIFRCFTCAQRTVELVHVFGVPVQAAFCRHCSALDMSVVSMGVLDITAGDVHGDGDGLVARVPSLVQKRTNRNDY